MPKISFSIAFPIIIAGIFILLAALAVNYQSLNFTAYGSVLAVFVFAFGAAIGRNFSGAVKKLLKHAENLAKGQAASRVHIDAKNELGELASTLNTLAHNLEAKEEEVRLLKKSLVAEVKAKTAPLQETIFALEQKVKNRTLEANIIRADFVALQTQLNSREAELEKLKSRFFAPKIVSKRRKINVEQS